MADEVIEIIPLYRLKEYRGLGTSVEDRILDFQIEVVDFLIARIVCPLIRSINPIGRE